MKNINQNTGVMLVFSMLIEMILLAIDMFLPTGHGFRVSILGFVSIILIGKFILLVSICFSNKIKGKYGYLLIFISSFAFLIHSVSAFILAQAYVILNLYICWNIVMSSKKKESILSDNTDGIGTNGMNLEKVFLLSIYGRNKMCGRYVLHENTGSDYSNDIRRAVWLINSSWIDVVCIVLVFPAGLIIVLGKFMLLITLLYSSKILKYSGLIVCYIPLIASLIFLHYMGFGINWQAEVIYIGLALAYMIMSPLIGWRILTEVEKTEEP